MRGSILLLMLLVAGCGGGTAPQANEATAAAPPVSLPPGQWELASEVTGFTKADSGAPRINTPVGTRATVSVCVGDGARAPDALFTESGYTCSTSGNYYARNGRLNVTMLCRRAGLQGDIPMTIDGTFTADGIDYVRNLRTILSTDGDVTIDSHVTGHRTGDCTPAPAGAGGNGH